MKRRVIGLVVVGLCLAVSSASSDPTMGAYTSVSVDCHTYVEGQWADTWWSFEAAAYTSVGGGPLGTIFNNEISMDYEAVCTNDLGCADYGNASNQNTQTYVTAYHSENGSVPRALANVEGAAVTSHTFEADLFQDYDETSDGMLMSCTGGGGGGSR